MDTYAPCSDTAFDKAAAEGLHVLTPLANELQVDIDSAAAMAQFERVLPILKQHVGVVGMLVTVSKSGGEGRHARVWLARTVSLLERIALQAALGSDGVREALSVVMVRCNDPHPTLLHETDAVARQVRVVQEQVHADYAILQPAC